MPVAPQVKTTPSDSNVTRPWGHVRLCARGHPCSALAAGEHRLFPGPRLSEQRRSSHSELSPMLVVCLHWIGSPDRCPPKGKQHTSGTCENLLKAAESPGLCSCSHGVLQYLQKTKTEPCYFTGNQLSPLSLLCCPCPAPWAPAVSWDKFMRSTVTSGR